MLNISRMKSLMSPTFAPFSPCLSKTTSFPLCFQASKSIFCNFPALQNPNFLHLRPTMSLFKSLISSTSIQNHSSRTEASQSLSGEIHVIVGPMFAGKTTTLLRRIQSEISNGSGLDIPNFSVPLIECNYHRRDIPSFQVGSPVKFLQLDKTLKGLCFSGRVVEAVGLLCRTGLQVDPGTYALLLQECIYRKEFKKGRRIHAQMVIVGYVPNEYLKTKLLILYAKAGDLETAHILLNQLLVKSLVSWNAMISGYVQKGLEEVGLSLYNNMRQSGVSPDQYTFASVFRACATFATLEQGKQAHGVMIKSQIGENVVVNSALMYMYFKCSSPYDGHRVFEKSLHKNVITWTALISGFGQHGRVVEVLEFFNRMLSEGFEPNYVTFLAVLSACSHGGLVNQGWEYFSSMTRDHGIKPSGKHYAAMVDLLGRAGRLQEAYEFVMNSPCEEHSVIWGALLGACRIHGDIDLAELAAKKYFELEPENAGKYIVLSNAYAAFGLWENVAEVRGVMRESGMKKEPGYSRLEVQQEVHFFFMGNNTHKQTEQIYEMIKEMTCILKDAGYVPDISGH